MTNQHPITPSPELVERCMEMFRSGTRMEAMCELAVQWGADQELEACLEWLNEHYGVFAFSSLRAARRPKPPSLKEQAIEALREAEVSCRQRSRGEMLQDLSTLRQALEALPNDN